MAYLLALTAVVFAFWVAGAIYYDACNASRRGAVLAVLTWAAIVAAVVFWRPIGYPLAAVAAVAAGVLAWWFNLPPSHDRDWRTELAVLPSATIDGDRFTLHRVRDTLYRSLDDVTPRYNDHAVRLSRLRTMDVLVSEWGSKLMCHPIAIFGFDDPEGPGRMYRVGFSLEVRARKGQGFSLTRNLYRQNELICVMATEHDFYRRRVDHEPGRRLHLYRLRIRPEVLRTRFLEYIDLVNAIHAEPRWYHALATNCTTAIVRRYRSNRPTMDWRVLVNGQMTRWLYDIGALETDGLEFDELHERSLINDRVRDASEERFGDEIRRGLPGFGVP